MSVKASRFTHGLRYTEWRSSIMKLVRNLWCTVLSFLLLVLSVAASPAASLEAAEMITLNRVKHELLTGEVTNVADVLHVASSYMEADFDSNGITANINDAGQLQITQDLGTSTEGNADVKNVASSTIFMLDADGDVYAYLDDYRENSGGLNEYSVFAVHTCYLKIRINDGLLSSMDIKMTYMETTLIYGTAIGAGQLIHAYRADTDSFGATYVYSVSSPINSPAEGRAYTYYPNDGWRPRAFYNAYMYSFAHITVGTRNFAITNQVQLG